MTLDDILNEKTLIFYNLTSIVVMKATKSCHQSEMVFKACIHTDHSKKNFRNQFGVEESLKLQSSYQILYGNF